MTAKVTLHVTMNMGEKYASLVGLVSIQIAQNTAYPKIMNKVITTALKQEENSAQRIGMVIIVQFIAKNIAIRPFIVTRQLDERCVSQIGSE
jgi:hypothetical protein